MAPRKQPKKTVAPVATPLKRSSTQMSGSPELESPATPTPFGPASIASTSRPRTVRPYRSPSVEDAPEEEEVAAQLAAKEMRTALGWKLSARRPVPESVGPLRAGSRDCCVKCSVTYYNYPGQICWDPVGLDKCGDCLQGNHRCVPVGPDQKDALTALQLKADAYLNCCADDEDAGLEDDSVATREALASLLFAQREFTTADKGKEPRTPKVKNKGKRAAMSFHEEPVAPLPEAGGPVVRNLNDPRQALLHHAETLAELDQANTKALKAAAATFHAATDAALDAYQVGLNTHVAALKFVLE
ncbi:hypothetical protein GMDG_04825 [Pseudogymnoascus destructans 20631-21]|uniref:Uncharacterized protein n=1 Tax=Pseudogymnoascus destructans (strain ATCC MYA-4855 / 20631-21) TaxID=658429 RepID=L8GEH3_PSED2|nr:hypothetical protein GMDG_04825 [Pseudogymnoascus destructans 20631-21]